MAQKYVARRRQAVPPAVRADIPANEFVRAADFVCSIAQDIAGLFADLNSRIAALALTDTLDWLNLWHDNNVAEADLDENFDTVQDHSAPQP